MGEVFVCLGPALTLATQISMHNLAMLNRAIKLAKKADVTISMSRRPEASESSSLQ